jgi:6-phosphofructokinase 1
MKPATACHLQLKFLHRERHWSQLRLNVASRNPPHRSNSTPVCLPRAASSDDGLGRVGFSVATLPDPIDDVLEIPDIRHMLQARPSPFVAHNNFGGGFIDDNDRVAINSLKFASAASLGAGCTVTEEGMYEDDAMVDENVDSQGDGGPDVCMPLPAWAHRAGARRTIYIDPRKARVGIVTCGGLCPGLNDVVEGLVNKCEDYGVPAGNILGIRYGFKGFYDRKHRPVVLTKRNVEGIHLEGGTILGTSRGGADVAAIVKAIDIQGFDVLFVVGGNGGNAGAASIQQALDEAKVPCAVIGVPKSIDNDILLVGICFCLKSVLLIHKGLTTCLSHH